jgi:hypothetical protein
VETVADKILVEKSRIFFSVKDDAWLSRFEVYNSKKNEEKENGTSHS